VKVALVAFAGTVMEDGTVTAAVLLARFTASPPEPAFEFKVIVQVSLSAPVTDVLLHVKVLNI